jgi:hypothetical protein
METKLRPDLIWSTNEKGVSLFKYGDHLCVAPQRSAHGVPHHSSTPILETMKARILAEAVRVLAKHPLLPCAVC